MLSYHKQEAIPQLGMGIPSSGVVQTSLRTCPTHTHTQTLFSIITVSNFLASHKLVIFFTPRHISFLLIV